MDAAGLMLALGALGVCCVFSWFMGFMFSRRGDELAEAARDRLMGAVGRLPVTPEHRPIEEIAADVRRCGIRYYALHPHASFAKAQAVRMAYDRALGECCQIFGLPHLLDVLQAGPELDVERERVEDALTASGVQLPRAA